MTEPIQSHTAIQLLLQHYNQVLKELNLKQTDSLETALQTLLTNDKFNREQSLQDLNLILTNNLRDEEERKNILNQVEKLYDNKSNINYFLNQFEETQSDKDQKSLLTLVLTILLLIVIFIIGVILLILKLIKQKTER